MRINQIIEQIYWVSKFGRPINKISSEELFSRPELVENSVFFLSTGRCGTEWFTHMMKKGTNTSVFHNPTPNLSVQNKFIHKLITEAKDISSTDEIAKQLLFTAREQYFRYAFKTGKRYIETNNHITFFAHTLAKLFPTAKFVHLYRHPGDFVSSGMNRGWFESNIAATEKIINPIDKSLWDNYSSLEKIGWVWNETNSFIENFKKEYPNRTFSYDFTKRNVTELSQLFAFLDINLSASSLEKSLNKKRNQQKNQQFPSYKNWNEDDKKNLLEICESLTKKYHYEL